MPVKLNVVTLCEAFDSSCVPCLSVVFLPFAITADQNSVVTPFSNINCNSNSNGGGMANHMSMNMNNHINHQNHQNQWNNVNNYHHQQSINQQTYMNNHMGGSMGGGMDMGTPPAPGYPTPPPMSTQCENICPTPQSGNHHHHHKVVCCMILHSTGWWRCCNCLEQ